MNKDSIIKFFNFFSAAQNEKELFIPSTNVPPNNNAPVLRSNPAHNMTQLPTSLQQHPPPTVQTAPPPQGMMMSSIPPPPPQQLQQQQQQQQQLQQQQQQQQLQQQSVPNMTSNYAHPSMTLMPQYMSYATPVTTTPSTATYYYPTCYQSFAQHQSTPASYQVPMYQEFVPPPQVPNVPPPTLTTMVPPPPPPLQTMAHYLPSNQPIQQQQQQQQQHMHKLQQQQHQQQQQQPLQLQLQPPLPPKSNELNNYPVYNSPQSQEYINPLLSIQLSHYDSNRKVVSSGYGSSSTTSTVSPPSTSGNKGENVSNNSNSNSSKNNAESRKRYFCDLCQISFPSQAVLENHISGSRHIRRLKTQQAFRQQLKDGAAQQQQQQQEGGPVRCEICQVTVNSSHQLQAHLEGQEYFI